MPHEAQFNHIQSHLSDIEYMHEHLSIVLNTGTAKLRVSPPFTEGLSLCQRQTQNYAKRVGNLYSSMPTHHCDAEICSPIQQDAGHINMTSPASLPEGSLPKAGLSFRGAISHSRRVRGSGTSRRVVI